MVCFDGCLLSERADPLLAVPELPLLDVIRHHVAVVDALDEAHVLHDFVRVVGDSPSLGRGAVPLDFPL